MAERTTVNAGKQRPAKRTTGNASKGFTEEEREAMRERAQELKVAARRGSRSGKRDAMWPTSFALKVLTTAEEARIAALVKRAVG